MRLLVALFAVAGAILAQEMQLPRIDTVAANQQFTDGPAWSPEGFLVFADVPAKRVLKVGSEGVSLLRDNSGGASGLAIDDKGRLYICETDTRRVVRMDKRGKIEVLAERFEGKRLNSPNDLVVSRGGHVYFTDPAFGKQAETRELDFYGVYHVTPKLELALVSRLPTRPNGIALSAGGDKLYVTNSDEKNVRVYEIAKTGVPSNERVLIKDIESIPAGIEVDGQGRLYVAAGGVTVYSSEGKRLLKVSLLERPSNLTFADPATMYVTARRSVYRLRWPAAHKGAEGN